MQYLQLHFDATGATRRRSLEDACRGWMQGIAFAFPHGIESPMTFDDIRARVPLSRIVSLATDLTHHGGGQWSGRCPICTLPRIESGLSVSDPAAIFVCAECKAAGNHVSFIVAAWGTSHGEAFQILEQEATAHYKPLATNTAVVRANGYSNHSMSPAGLNLSLGEPIESFRLKDATLICALVDAPGVALDNAERIAERTGARTAVGAVLDVLAALDAPSPSDARAAVLGGPARVHLEAARSICHQRGVSDATIQRTAVALITGERK